MDPEAAPHRANEGDTEKSSSNSPDDGRWHVFAPPGQLVDPTGGIGKDINIEVKISDNASSVVEYNGKIIICYYIGESRAWDSSKERAKMATYEERIIALMTRIAELRSSGDPVLVTQADDIERGIVDLERTRYELDIRSLQMQQEIELEQFKLQYELESKLTELEFMAGAASSGTFEERIAALKTRAAELRSTGDPELIKQAEDIERGIVDLERTKFEFDLRILQMQQAVELEKLKVQYELESKLRELEFKAYEAPEPPAEEEPAEVEPAVVVQTARARSGRMSGQVATRA